MTEIQHRLTYALNRLHAMLADVPASVPANWLAHCLTRLFFWRAVSVHWQVAPTGQRAQLATGLHLSETTLFPVITNPAAFLIAPAPILLKQTDKIANTLAALCQAQPNAELWHATLAPEQFRVLNPDDARVLLRLHQDVMLLCPDHDHRLSASVFNGMVAILPPFQPFPATPPDLANLLIDLLQPQASDIIFDPCCGTGDLLCRVAHHLQQAQKHSGTDAEIRPPQLIGEDRRADAIALARLNLFLHGWGHGQLAPRHHPELLGLRRENNQALWVDVIVAVLPTESRIDLAWHALESLHPERGRMALVVAPPLLASQAGQALLRFLAGKKVLHAVIELPEPGLPGRKYTPHCLLIDYRHTSTGIAFISPSVTTGQAASEPPEDGWQTIRHAWQAYLQDGSSPNYSVLSTTTETKHPLRRDSLQFAPIWDVLLRACEAVAKQERQNVAAVRQVRRSRRM